MTAPTVDVSSPSRPRLGWMRWVLLAVVLALVAGAFWFLRTPALEDGSFQDFPGSTVGEGVVTYGLTDGGDAMYVLSAKNASLFPVSLVSADTDGSTFTTSSVELGDGQPVAQAGTVVVPGDEVRFVVRGSLVQLVKTDCEPFTNPVPSVIVTYKQLGIERTATISAAGHAVVRTC